MPAIDVAMLLEDLSADAPCGPDLEYSFDYIEAARLMQGSPDVQYGSMHIAAVEPNWKAVKSLTLKLLAQTRDLRLAVWLTRALVALQGFAGLNDGLALVEGMLERHWDHLHPQLDATDDNDPTARINTLISLDDKDDLVQQALVACLVESTAHGRFSLRDVEIARGERAAAPNEAAPDLAAFDAACMAMAFDELNAVAALLAAAADRMAHIDALLTERAGHLRVVGLTVLQQTLRRAHEAVSSRLERHPGRVVEALPQEETGEGAAVSQAGDHIGTREHVIRQLDRLCEYYARHEPGSPVPLLLQRARRLVDLNFLEILSDLSPGSLDEIRRVAGIESV